MTKEILLTRGAVTIVDDEDYEELIKYKWHLTAQGYAARRVTIAYYQSKVICMHRLILKYDGELLVDHINGNKLDNRKSNLRVATKAQNTMNSPKRSGVYKGVSKYGDMYRARITAQGKEIHLGSFDNPHDAARMYNFWAKDIFGDYARLNTIEE